MKLSLCTIAFRERLLEDAINIAQQIGFDGVEIWGREPHISENFDERRVRAARKMIEDRNLEICGLGSYLRFQGGTPPEDDEEDSPDLASVLHTARVLGAPTVRVWAGSCPSSKARRRDWNLCVQELQAACEKAANVGAELAVEMQSGTFADTAASANRLLDDVGALNLKLNYQPGNGLPPENPVKRLRSVVNRLASVRVRNYDRLISNPDDHQHIVPLAEGVFDYRELISILRKAGFQGYLSVEEISAKAPDKVDALKAEYDFLRALLDE